MKLQNTTAYPNHLLRRLVVWACRKIDMPLERLQAIQFSKSKHRNRGTAWYRHIRVTLSDEKFYPWTNRYRKSAPEITYADREEWLVSLVTHELWHIKSHWKGWKTDEAQNERVALEVLDDFRANREALWTEWSKEKVHKAKATVSAVDRRAKKAARDLERWTRKLKLAQTKVRKARQRVRYYERSAAARNSNP